MTGGDGSGADSGGSDGDPDADQHADAAPDSGERDGDPDADQHADAAPDSGERDGDPDADQHADAAPDPAEDWRAALAASGRLTPAIVDAVVSAHGSRGRRAIEAVSEGRIKQYRDFTVVVGHDDEYIVEDGQCTCKDAEYNLSTEDPTQRCWHAIAVDVAEALDEVDYHDMWYSEVREFL